MAGLLPLQPGLLALVLLCSCHVIAVETKERTIVPVDVTTKEIETTQVPQNNDKKQRSLLWECSNDDNRCMYPVGAGWRRTNGAGYPVNSYKPRNDVTYNNSSGKYMLATKSDGEALVTARMVTETIKIVSHGHVCAEFWYHLDASSSGPKSHLMVGKTQNNKTGLLWQSHGKLVPGWKKLQLGMAIRTGALEIGFMFMSKGQGHSSAAVDDVRVAAGVCPSESKDNLRGEWGPWGLCSYSKGIGIRRRTRICSEPRCEVEAELCVWSPGSSGWTPWTVCSVSCGYGFRSRDWDGRRETSVCNIVPCPQTSKRKRKQTGCGNRSVDQSLYNIIGGQESKSNSWPWQVGILVDGQLVCGGSIISRLFVVTAAQCTSTIDQIMREDASNVSVLVGAHTITRGRSYKLRRLIPHHQFNSISKKHDIALLETATEIEFSPSVSPICLPEREPSRGAKCFATGWGVPPGRQSAGLKEIRMDMVIREMCHVTLPMVSKGHLCAEGDLHRNGVLQGDPGGPLACSENHKYYLAGVTSFSARGKAVDVFTNVMYYIDWILQKTGMS